MFILKVIAISYGLLSVILTFIVDLLGPSVLQVTDLHKIFLHFELIFLFTCVLMIYCNLSVIPENGLRHASGPVHANNSIRYIY